MAREYAKVSQRFWTGDTGKKLRKNRDAQVLAAYLISAPGSSMTGIYYLALPIISHETGMTMPEIIDAMAFLTSIGFAQYDGEQELIWVPSMATWQIDDVLKPGDKRIHGIRRELAQYGAHPFVLEFWTRYGESFALGEGPSGSQEGAYKALRSQEQDQDQDQEQEQEQTCLELRSEPSDPPVLVFPCAGKPEAWSLTGGNIATWSGLFPAADVDAECRKALAWVLANPAKKKTHGGMPKFLTRWLSEAQDRGRVSPRGSPSRLRPMTVDQDQIASRAAWREKTG